MLKSVRVFYKKNGRMRFVSHLDMNRFMTRIIRRTDIPVWYTEGYNTHAYITFALPLSLGFESEYEIMDFKLNDESYSLEKVKSQLMSVMPEYIEIIKVAEPVNKVAKLSFAEFNIWLDDKIGDELEEFLAGDIICTKKNKKGVEKQIDIGAKIVSYRIDEDEKTLLDIILPAGSADNINPSLLLDEFFKKRENSVYYFVTRTMLFDDDMCEFV